jgi:FAD/FMN-containing dehydrogenase
MPPRSLTDLIHRDARSRAAYAEGAGIYRIVPAGVAAPRSIEDLRLILAATREAELSLIPRGAGSGMAGGNVGDGVLVDLTRLDRGKLVVNPARREAVAAAGVACAALQEEAGRHGLRFPPSPSSWRFATLAGMVATNASGARSFRFGSIRRWVTGLTMLTADGETLALRRGEPADLSVAAVRRFQAVELRLRAAAELVTARFPRVRKNSSGYALDHWLASGDLLDLVVGSEGTLGLVTEVCLRLDRIPPWRGGLRLGLPNDDALGKVLGVLREGDASAIELLDRTFLELVRETVTEGDRRVADAAAVLLVEFEGERSVVESALAAARDGVAPQVGEVETASGPGALDALWRIRHAASPLLARRGEGRRSLQVIEDGCVPPERLPDYLAALRRITAEEGVPAVVFGHAGDGHLHVNLLADTAFPGWTDGISRIYERVSEVVCSLGGTPSGEHGDGRLRASLLERVYGPEVMKLFRLVKQAFDPDGFLNPGVKFPGPEGPLQRLKVGAAAAPIPDDIAAALRDIEREGHYDLPRFELVSSAPVCVGFIP